MFSSSRTRNCPSVRSSVSILPVGAPAKSQPNRRRPRPERADPAARPARWLWLAFRRIPEQYLPGLDARDLQHLHANPRICGQPLADVLLPGGPDQEEESGSVTDRAAEDDETVVGERLHEGGMLRPRLLASHGQSRDPGRTGL